MGLLHKDTIVDGDAKCTIDPATRRITIASGKSTLVQYDHNSERVGFLIPQYIDGHDMSLSDRVTITYINGSTTDAYIVDDLETADEGVTFSWLISSNATQEVGALKFNINFRCMDSDGNVTYNWTTMACEDFKVLANINAPPSTETQGFLDKLTELQTYFGENVASAVNDYLKTNPVTMKDLTFTGEKQMVYNGTTEQAVAIPYKTSELTNDNEYQTEDQVQEALKLTDDEGNKYKLSIENNLLVITQVE